MGEPLTDQPVVIEGAPIHTQDEKNAQSQNNPDGAETTKPTDGYLHGIKLIILTGALYLVMFIVLLNASIVGTAVPKITSQFHSTEDVGWYSAAYLIANCALLPLTGKIYSLCPLKITWVAFLWTFGIGSLLCGVATSSTFLIACRAIAGLGGSGVTSGTLAVINAAASLENRALLIGLAMTFSGIGTVIGPVIGGALTQEAGWRWCFFLNPIILAPATIIVMVIRFPTRPQDAQPFSLRHTLRSLDLIGFAIFAPAAVLLLVALQWGGTTYAWGSAQVIGLICGSAGFAVVFLIWEYFQKKEAMIPLNILTERHVLCAYAAIAVQMGSLVQLTYYLPIWFQAVKNSTPITSGVHMLPLSISEMLFATAAGFLVRKSGQYTPWSIVGSALTSIGSGLLCTLTPTTSTGKWIGYEILLGARAIVMQTCMVVVQRYLPKEQENIGSTLAIFCQMFSGSIFIAVTQAIFTNSLGPALNSFAPEVSKAQILKIGALNLRSLPPAVIPGVIKAYNQALVHGFYLTTAGAVAGFVVSFGMGFSPLRTGQRKGASPA